tara:strand:+ start:3533 stop:4450 length:918 start_codon:yes stop_codon:yes gene_type:complete
VAKQSISLTARGHIAVAFDLDVSNDRSVYDIRNIPVYVESGLTVNIDPVTPQLWLPTSACVALASALGLQWDESTQLYLINATTHARLLQWNYTITFSLSSSRSQGAIKNFTFPIDVFDLTVTYPFVNSSSRYFPLKRASRSDQYVLGRAFLQETHLSVDYDTKYFNLSQAKFSGNDTNLVRIRPQPATIPQPSTLSSGAYAGIGIGSAVFILLLVYLLFAWRKAWRPFTPQRSFEARLTKYEKPELHDKAVPRVEAMEKERIELEAKEPAHEAGRLNTVSDQLEIAGLSGLHEMEATETSTFNL